MVAFSAPFIVPIYRPTERPQWSRFSPKSDGKAAAVTSNGLGGFAAKPSAEPVAGAGAPPADKLAYPPAPACPGESRGQYICCPPFMLIVEPVTKAALSLHRKLTPRAISSAWPSRPTGILATIFSSTGGGTAATMSVSI